MSAMYSKKKAAGGGASGGGGGGGGGGTGAGGDGTKLRVSTRTKTISKSMRLVDEDTRREVRERRIQQLEADNYMEEQSALVADDDDAYGESDVSANERGQTRLSDRRQVALFAMHASTPDVHHTQATPLKTKS